MYWWKQQTLCVRNFSNYSLEKIICRCLYTLHTDFLAILKFAASVHQATCCPGYDYPDEDDRKDCCPGDNCSRDTLSHDADIFLRPCKCRTHMKNEIVLQEVALHSHCLRKNSTHLKTVLYLSVRHNLQKRCAFKQNTPRVQ